MEQRRVGRTGLHVSEVGLGTMTWGRDTDEHEAAEQLRTFVDAGGTLVDTSATYSDGMAEEILGSMLSGEIDRADVVLCSKAGVRAGRLDASRGNLLTTLDESLRRLGTDYLDLWLVQAPDPGTPLHETVDALDQAVRSGKVRYVGLSNHAAWQVARVATMLEPRPGLAAVEQEYSLLNRSPEADLVPACAEVGAGLLTWSSLGRGVLSGKYRHSTPPDSRAASPHLRGFVEPYLNDRAQGIVAAVATAAQGLDRHPVEVALAWVRDAPGVSSSIVGVRTPAHLADVLNATSLELPEEIRAALDDVSSS